MSEVTNATSSLVSTTLSSFWNAPSEDSTNSTSTSTSSNSSSLMQTANQSYGINYVNQLADAAAAAFQGLGLGANDRVSFAKIAEYTDQLKNEFAEKVAADLAELGVSEDAEYQIVSNYNGEGVSIVSDSEDTAKIIQYFNDNPEMVEQFEQIQYLDNINSKRSAQDIALNLEISRIQLQSMSSLFATSASSSIMSYGAGSTYFGQGFSTIV